MGSFKVSIWASIPKEKTSPPLGPIYITNSDPFRADLQAAKSDGAERNMRAGEPLALFPVSLLFYIPHSLIYNQFGALK